MLRGTRRLLTLVRSAEGSDENGWQLKKGFAECTSERNEKMKVLLDPHNRKMDSIRMNLSLVCSEIVKRVGVSIQEVQK